jgi:uncharacterized protein (TIGR00269 family)
VADDDKMKCSQCKNDAIIFLSYANKFLCGKHLVRSLEKRVGNNIRKYDMITGKRKIGVGISGGKDSLTLLYVLKEILGENRKIEIVGITIDEGIKGYRDESIKNARNLCDSLGIKHYIYTFKEHAKDMDEIMKNSRSDPCSYCGVFRRWILNKACKELEIDVLAIGHNLDDTVQTLQMNIMRNEPLRIARFRPSGGIMEDEDFIPRIRPLFNIPEREIVAYALYKGIDFHNAECPYSGLALRNPVRKFINEMENEYPGIKFRMLNSYLSMLNTIKIPDNLKIKKCKICKENSSNEICKRCLFLNEL